MSADEGEQRLGVFRKFRPPQGFDRGRHRERGVGKRQADRLRADIQSKQPFSLRQRLPQVGKVENGGTSAATLRTTNISPGSVSKRSEEHTSELQSLMRISYAV